MKVTMLEPTNEEFNQKVCQKFNTSLQQVQKDVEILKEWIRQQPHLPQCSSDTLLTTFLIASKNRMERAKEKIDNYYTARCMMPEYFCDRDPEGERVRLIDDSIWHFTLPKLTPEGYRLHLTLFASDDGQKFDIPAHFKRIMALDDITYNSESFCVGNYFIIDCKLFNSSHLLRMTPTLARDFVFCFQDVMPVIITGVLVINSPSYVELALNILRPFMKKKLLKKVHVFKGGAEVLERFFPRKLLPRDYGGEEETSAKLQDASNQLLREKRAWLMGEGSLTVDEKKRIGSSRKNGLQEMQGSFKTLCVD